MRPINEIIIHCTATRPEWREKLSANNKVEEVRRWHVDDNGWRDIGYHFLIDRDGTVVSGRPVEQMGAHVSGHNRSSIGIALFGGHGGSADDRFADNFTASQDEALRTKIADLMDQFPSIEKVSGHNEYANKACPCFRVSAWLSESEAWITKGDDPPAIASAAESHETSGRTSATQSTTIRASVAQIIASAGAVWTALTSLEGTAQIVALSLAGAIVLLAVWIMRERLKKWADGIR